MISASQIRERLAALLDGKVSLELFEDWFAQNTLNIHQSGSVAAEDLTFSVEESLSEYSSHHINEQELRDELVQILHSGTCVIESPQTVFRLRSSAPVRFVTARL